ncbi:MAG: hypothetical protein JXA18_00745 [Chitinispirillaceae bacterium]|nr:hypothetical protein [Chitinispirillaceae bacterium]
MPGKKAKNSGGWRRAFFSLLGNARSRKFFTFLLRKNHKAPAFHFPIDITSVKNILLILPEDRLLVLHQLKNVISLMTLYKHAAVTLLCERSAAAYIKMVPGLNLIEYDAQYYYSAGFSRLAQQFRGSIDICFLLDTEPGLPVLYMAGSTAAPVRIGYGDAGEFPFLNLHIRPSPKRVYLTDWYCSMAEIFGSRPGEIRWRVAQKTVEEVDHLIRELKINPDVPLIGFDALHFLHAFGIAWTERFMHRVNDLHLGTIYFHVEDTRSEEELVWLCKQNLPSFADLSASRLAALVSKSRFIVSGNTPMYALAGLLHRPAFGFFREDAISRFCPQNLLLKGIVYSDRPDDEAIERMIDLIGKPAKRPQEK